MDGQINIKSYLSELNIDNTRGSTKYCTLTDRNGKMVQIEYDVVNERVEIEGVRLTTMQRKILIAFMNQKEI